MLASVIGGDSFVRVRLQFELLEHVLGLASLSVGVCDAVFRFLCLRMSMVRMPRRARAATPPTTAPTIRVVGGWESAEEVVIGTVVAVVEG